jgi:hypothetical protein
VRTAALIENGCVTNVIVIGGGADGDKALSDFNAVEITNLDVRIGDEYDGSSFTRIKTSEEIEAEQRFQERLVQRAAVLEKLGLTEEEARLLGL